MIYACRINSSRSCNDVVVAVIAIVNAGVVNIIFDVVVAIADLIFVIVFVFAIVHVVVNCCCSCNG